jgi:hypothetical protein
MAPSTFPPTRGPVDKMGGLIAPGANLLWVLIAEDAKFSLLASTYTLLLDPSILTLNRRPSLKLFILSSRMFYQRNRLRVLAKGLVLPVLALTPDSISSSNSF